jgi:hypothetical protein
MQGFSTHFCSLKNLTSNKKIIHTCNQINRELYVRINK